MFIRPVGVIQDRKGRYIAADAFMAVRGYGASREEAIEDFDRVLDARLAFLRAHADELDAGLAEQLAKLERLFPDR